MKKYYSSWAVIGLGFGDEGKGVVVNSLCQQFNKPLVIRYSGGQQAGHTVTRPDGTSHVFSNFGSGSFDKIPTYWSKYCTFDPVGAFNEFQILKSKGVTPVLYLDRKSPITTPYDIKFNQTKEGAREHGTCGVGVGDTLQREEKLYSLLVEDLLYPDILQTKLDLIGNYYGIGVNDEDFLECCDFVRKNFMIVYGIPEGYENYIFEGSQGLLLDKNIGFFPHVTRSNVGSKNILEMGHSPNLFLVTRAFQTRHGYGPMSNLDIPHNIKDNPKETNVLNEYQGEFKKSILDLDLLKYAIEKDEYIRTSFYRHLVITCLDLVKDEYKYTINGKIISHSSEDSFVKGISEHLNIGIVHRIRSPDGLVWAK